MPELNFQITGVEAAAHGLTPLMHFKLRIDAPEAGDSIRGLLLNVQIQIQCPQRSYTAEEKEKLGELFGAPERWGQTLRNRLWTQAHATVGAFAGATETLLPVQCTYDLNVASAKYFYALADGEVSLLFLFSGSVFYDQDGRLQVQQISWDKECVYRMPVRLWRDMMREHYPHSGWVSLHEDILDRLYAFRRCQGLASWEQTIEQLLQSAEDTFPVAALGTHRRKEAPT